MAAVVSISTNISHTLAHAISFLTRPLLPSYPATALAKLRSVLDANLTSYYAPLWAAREPLRNPTRCYITLSPDRLPPSVIYSACLAADVQWFDWISLLGGREFDLFVEPGRVSVRCGRKNYTSDMQWTTVWAAQPASAPLAVEPSSHRTLQMPVNRGRPQAKTLAQQLLEVDYEDDEQLFTLIADEVSSPTWALSTQTHRSAPIRSSSPLSTISAHSRSSSRSSNSSSCFSLVSAVSSGSVTSMSTSPSPGFSDNRPRFETAKPTRVFVDTSKTEVTPYDGGKTTVLTGGVMLGGVSTTSKSKVGSGPTMRPAYNSRSVRS